MGEPESKEKEKPCKLEDVAEETGKLVGKGVKKAWNVTKSFGKGLVGAVDKTDKDSAPSACPQCGAPIPPHSSFCSSCGKKL